FGQGLGPSVAYGLESVFFEEEGADSKGAGAVIYDLLNLRGTPIRSILGNMVVELTSKAADPRLLAEPLLDTTTNVGLVGPYDSGALLPSFAGLAPKIDFHYHIFNPSP